MNSQSPADRIYKNDGNLPLIDMIDGACGDVLDVGCGSGDNALLIRARFPGCQVDGITRSRSEAALAGEHMRDCWVFDIENAIPNAVQSRAYDIVILSHVLEHLREPEVIVSTYSRLLKPGGILLIAVPNILSWRMRAKFLRGDFAYTETGPLDVTHLRFFTFHTADKFLLARSTDLVLQSKIAHGSFPLWLARRHLLTEASACRIDHLACRRWPNLFGDQVLLKVAKPLVAEAKPMVAGD